MVSHVSEDIGVSEPEEAVVALAVRKAEAVLERAGDALVIGCDSMLEIDGRLWGKPADAGEAASRWMSMRGRSGRLLTGHCLIDNGDGRRVSAAEVTTVNFAEPTESEIAAYVASGEPLAVAGAFTLDGLSAPFVRGIEGDPGNVIGLCLPLLREMLATLGISIVDLWASRSA